MERCIEALSLRGITRIWCAHQIPRILQFLTEQGHVNVGIMRNVPRPFPFPDVDGRGTILVVGAGAAGLSAAYHLRNFGFQVSGHSQSVEEGSVGPNKLCAALVLTALALTPG